MNAAQQTRGVEPVLALCWASVADGEPALGQLPVFAGSVYHVASAWLQKGIINSA